MARKHAYLTGIVAGSLVAAFAGCADDGTTSTSDELATNEFEIAALRGSGQATQSAAAGCFDAFKTCEASAAAGSTTCRDQLKACLPAKAPEAPGCGAGHDGGSVQGPSGDATVADGGGRKDRGPGAQGQDGGVPAPDADRPGHAADGGRPAPSADGGKPEHTGDAGKPEPKPVADGGRPEHVGDAGVPSGPQGPGHGHGDDDDDGHGQCGHVDLPHGAVGGCREHATSAMQGGMSMDHARSSHHSCVEHAFGDKLDKLCAKATKLCAQADAPADRCASIKAACATPSQTDAAVPSQSDAGHRDGGHSDAGI